MAIVKVSGVVSRLHSTGGGFTVRESWEGRDGERTRYWAVFPKTAVQVAEGDQVQVSGVLQTRVTDPKPDGRVFVDHVVSNADMHPSDNAQGTPDARLGVGMGKDMGEPVNAPQIGVQGGFEEVPF